MNLDGGASAFTELSIHNILLASQPFRQQRRHRCDLTWWLGSGLGLVAHRVSLKQLRVPRFSGVDWIGGVRRIAKMATCVQLVRSTCGRHARGHHNQSK